MQTWKQEAAQVGPSVGSGQLERCGVAALGPSSACPEKEAGVSGENL